MNVSADEIHMFSYISNTSPQVKMNNATPSSRINFSTIIGYFLPLFSSRSRIVVAALVDKISPTYLGQIISIPSHVEPSRLPLHQAHYDDSKMHLS
jgi:hypothetical protein